MYILLSVYIMRSWWHLCQKLHVGRVKTVR